MIIVIGENQGQRWSYKIERSEKPFVQYYCPPFFTQYLEMQVVKPMKLFFFNRCYVELLGAVEGRFYAWKSTWKNILTLNHL